MNEFKTNGQGTKDIYTIEYRTNSRANYEEAQELLRKFVDNNPKTNFDRITESVESLAEHMVHLCYETYYDCNRCEMDSRPYYTTVTGACYYTKEGAIQHTIEWLQKECEG